MRSRFANQDPSVVSRFEVLGAYFTDIYYNHVYSSARAKITGNASLTDVYTQHINSYVLGVKSDTKCYEDTVRGLRGYYEAATQGSSVSFGRFVDTVVGIFVPAEYYQHFTNENKDSLMSSIVYDLVANLAAKVTTPDMLRRIIDDRKVGSEVTVRLIQDAAVGILFHKRTELSNRFLKKKHQARDLVPADSLNDMKAALRQLAKDKAEATARANALENAVYELKELLQQTKTRNAKLEKMVGLLRQAHIEGPAAAGRALTQPRPNTLGETYTATPSRRPPRRDRLGEAGDDDHGDRYNQDDGADGDEGDGDDGDGDDGDGDEDEKNDDEGGDGDEGADQGAVRGGGRRGASDGRHGARAGRPGPRAPPAESGGRTRAQAPKRRGGTLARDFFAPVAPAASTASTAGAGSRAPEQPGRGGAPAGRGRPAMLASLMSDTVDAGDDGDGQ